MRLFGRTRKPPPRHWFHDPDGTYYRNCPLIRAEQDQVLRWPSGSACKLAALDALAAEWRSTFREGVQRKASLGPCDVVATPAPFREAYPDNSGLWVLDELERRT